MFNQTQAIAWGARVRATNRLSAATALSILAATLVGCGAPAPKEYGGSWTPVNRFQSAATEIPLSPAYTFYASPMDATLRTMLKRWASDTSLATIDAGKQQICQQLIQLRVQAFNDSIEMANRFEQYSEQLTKIDKNRGSAKTQGDLWANTNESLRTIGKLQAEMGFWRTRLAAYESAIKFHEGQQNALSQTAIKGSGLPSTGQLIQTGALAAALAIK